MTREITWRAGADIKFIHPASDNWISPSASLVDTFTFVVVVARDVVVSVVLAVLLFVETPHAARRYAVRFNDLARAAEVNDLVKRSISGHLADQMQRHYSTMNGSEQREALATVISLFDRRPGNPSGGGKGAKW